MLFSYHLRVVLSIMENFCFAENVFNQPCVSDEINLKSEIVLPIYLKKLMQETKMAHFNYIHCRSQANYITFCELYSIYKYELDMFKKNGDINFPNSLAEIQKNIENAISAGYKLYGETNEERFLNILVGLDCLKDIVEKIKELKFNEYNLIINLFNDPIPL